MDKDGVLYRWKTTEEDWKINPNNSVVINANSISGRYNVFHVQASFDSSHWSEDSILILIDEETTCLKFYWSDPIDSGLFHQWSMNDREWQDAIRFDEGNSGGLLPLDGLAIKSNYRLFVRSSYDGNHWNEPSTFHFVLESAPTNEVPSVPEKEGIWSVGTNIGYSVGVYDFYNGHDTEGPRVFTVSDYGFSASLELDCRISSICRSFLEVAGEFERKNPEDIIYPNGFSIYYGRTALGFDYTYTTAPDGELSLYGGLSAGFMMHFFSYSRQSSDRLTLLYTPSAVIGGRIGWDWHISDSLTIGLRSSLHVGHLWSEDPYMRSFTWLVEPISLSAEVKF